MGSAINYNAGASNEQPTKAPVQTSKATIAKSSTVWGAVFAILGHLLGDPAILGLIPPKVGGIVTGIGAIISVIGARNAIAKNGNGQ